MYRIQSHFSHLQYTPAFQTFLPPHTYHSSTSSLNPLVFLCHTSPSTHLFYPQTHWSFFQLLLPLYFGIIFPLPCANLPKNHPPNLNLTHITQTHNFWHGPSFTQHSRLSCSPALTPAMPPLTSISLTARPALLTSWFPSSRLISRLRPYCRVQSWLSTEELQVWFICMLLCWCYVKSLLFIHSFILIVIRMWTQFIVRRKLQQLQDFLLQMEAVKRNSLWFLKSTVSETAMKTKRVFTVSKLRHALIKETPLALLL
jgi:hypothetical protein